MSTKNLRKRSEISEASKSAEAEADKWVSLGFFGAGICFLVTLFFEIIVWKDFASLQDCYYFSPSYSICSRGHFVFEYFSHQLVAITVYGLSVDVYAIESYTLLSTLFLVLSFCFRERGNEKFKIIGTALTVVVFEINVLTWTVRIGQSQGQKLGGLVAIFVNNFLGQDLTTLLLLGCVFASCIILFSKFGNLTETISLSIASASLCLASLPVFIYLFDNNEFSMHFEAGFASFYWVTNFSLLEISVLTSLTFFGLYSIAVYRSQKQEK